jgi:hypothetical protein
MRLLPTIAFVLTPLFLGQTTPPPATAPATRPVAPLREATPTQSAMETDATGWTDLLADHSLARWKRVKYSDKPLKPANSWSFDEASNLLVCDGKDAVELYLYDQEFSDGIFHVEWRFKPVENGRGYNSGVFVRANAAGDIWHQAQVGDRNVGNLFGRTRTADGTLKSFNANDRVAQRGKPPGEWNTYEITAKGKTLSLWINGAVTATWNDCLVEKGMVGLEAEGFLIEFRNVKFKPLP